MASNLSFDVSQMRESHVYAEEGNLTTIKHVYRNNFQKTLVDSLKKIVAKTRGQGFKSRQNHCCLDYEIERNLDDLAFWIYILFKSHSGRSVSNLILFSHSWSLVDYCNCPQNSASWSPWCCLLQCFFSGKWEFLWLSSGLCSKLWPLCITCKSALNKLFIFPLKHHHTTRIYCIHTLL